MVRMEDLDACCLIMVQQRTYILLIINICTSAIVPLQSFRNDDHHEILRKELVVMRECAGPHLLRATDVDFDKGILYIEQAMPLSELLNSHYFCLRVEDFVIY